MKIHTQRVDIFSKNRPSIQIMKKINTKKKLIIIEMRYFCILLAKCVQIEPDFARK